MRLLKLNIVNDIPSSVGSQPINRLVQVLNEATPSWIIPGVINLKLVDDEEIQALNKSYSGNDYATDVLTFSYVESGFDSKVSGNLELPELGDMVISLETAGRQAVSAGITTAEELATLALHGILHVHGFDHNELQDQAEMDQIQSDFLAKAKIMLSILLIVLRVWELLWEQWRCLSCSRFLLA